MSQQSSNLTGCLSRVGSIYTAIAVITFSTLLLILVIENSIRVARDIRYANVAETCQHFAGCDSRRAQLPYYQEQDWGEEFWDTPIARARDYPYSMWHTRQHEDKFATFDEEGFRVTPNSQCTENAYTIFVFGGSTVWGEGAPDWGTIPAYVQDLFNNKTDMIVCVRNMGQRAFHSTQEVVELVNQLQLGARPDMVIFYDGVNEVGNTIEAGEPWIPSAWNWQQQTSRVSPVERIITQSNINWFVNRFRQEIASNPSKSIAFSDDEIDAVTTETVDVYLNNYHIVEGLSQQFDFKFYFFWQPFLGVGKKSLTVDEEEILAVDLPIAGPGYFPDPLTFIQQVFAEIEYKAQTTQHLYYISDVLDDYDQQIYFDIWHVTPEGSEIIANRIFETIASDVVN